MWGPGPRGGCRDEAPRRARAPGATRTWRIAHVLPSFQVGGQERVALDLARTYRSRGHHVVAFSIDRAPEGALGRWFRAAGVETRTVRKGPRVDPTLVLRLAAHFARERIDVVHTHNPPALIYGAPAAKLAGAAVVHTKHGENRQPARRVALRRAMARFADAFVAVSRATADAARASGDVDEGKLRVIPNGIDLARFRRDAAARAEVRRELGIPPDAWVTGTVGRLSAEKNQIALVRALAGALGPGRRLVVVGDGPQASALARGAADAGAAAWVHLAGVRGDVPRVLSAFDVFALPSTTEGLPLVLLEAMATALPVVASAVGGVPGVVADGETGFLVPPGDLAALRARLLALCADPARARAMGARAHDVARANHSLERMSDAYLAVYAAVLETRRAARAAARGHGPRSPAP